MREIYPSPKKLDYVVVGHNISATHIAMSSTRIMGTCAILGQAVGTAATIAVREGVTPRGVYENYITELQETLMEDDCYLPVKSASHR